MSQKRNRRQFTGEQKAAIVKRHLVDQVSVSDLCDEYKILPTQFYQWQRQLFENGAAAFDRKAKGRAFELAFEVASPERVDATYARLVRNGATAIAAPADKPWGHRVAFFADPDGNIHDVFARR